MGEEKNQKGIIEREVRCLQRTLREKRQVKKRLIERVKRLEYEMGVLLKEISRRKSMVFFFFFFFFLLLLLFCFLFFVF